MKEMIRYSFRDDYSEGCHPSVLKKLEQTNLLQQIGYGDDEYCNEAKEIIKKQINNKNADVHFVSGGTQANLLVISSILKPYESVISADTGHINVHEAGAIEATGHKISYAVTEDGILRVDDIKTIIEEHTDEHMVKPAMVYISDATELGTVYKKNNLMEISKFCKENNLMLYLDGARIGTALTSVYNELTLEEVSNLVDVFYIGGTKNGALIGEAIVINNDKLKENFRFNMKMRGALLAKGRILGIQFLELFKNNLFFKLAENSNKTAQKLYNGIKELGYEFVVKPEANLLFPIFPNNIIQKLLNNYRFHRIKKINNEKSIVRMVTSFNTPETIIDEFLNDLKKIT